ncbi:cytochrome ubiquinol oxidase subunit I [Streptomyces flavidovirens]|uniref:cytochrome ubiquinol oxidase subunit I n=1 Tax=Streptomyces flavidovirens TaxID=67298 RepID=UPI0033A9A5B1
MEPETLDLARLQFALTAGGHFLFVALTLGLATVVAVIQTRAVFSGDPVHARMVRFWGQLYVINYAVGIVTGIVMEFQFGMAWSGLGHYAGSVFGASLAIETIVAFFVESTFLGLWIFGWNRFGQRVHLALLWVVTLTAYLSAYWILVTNGFLNHPVGYRETPEGLVIGDTWALLTNPSTLFAFFHIAGGALVTAAFFMAGVSAYHLFRRTSEYELFRRSLRIGVFVALPAVFFTAAVGGAQFPVLREYQPAKMAVFQSDPAEMARLQGDMAAKFGPGDYLPSEAWTRAGAIVMLSVFGLMFFIAVLGVVLGSIKWAVYHLRPWHVLLMAVVPLPFVAMTAGWVFREAGRQPWVIYGLLRTRDAGSALSTGQLRLSLTVFGALFVLLIAVNWWLLLRAAGRGPSGVALGTDDRSEDGSYDPPLPVHSY